jgi:3-hydroxyacyl-[acyl-carrier-protein] dehydratase
LAVTPDEIESFARTGRKKILFEPRPEQAVDLGRAEIEKLLPHRDPFLFVDRVTAFDRTNGAITGERWINPADPLFKGHFPGEPIYPGVLQLETMGQLGLCLIAMEEPGENRALRARAFRIHHAIFVLPVRPGDQLSLSAKLIESDDYTAVCAGQIIKDGAVAAFALMEVYFVES